MKEFDYSGETKVNAAVVSAYLEAFGPYKQRGEKVLCKYFGVTELKKGPDVWFPLAQFLKALEEFQNQFGREFMKKVGETIFSNAVFPPGIDSVEKAMSMLNEAYYMNHKTDPGEIGGYHFTTESPSKGHMICDNPYPCRFDHGILEVLSKTFSSKAKISHADDKTCRHKGGDSCHYKIEW